MLYKINCLIRIKFIAVFSLTILFFIVTSLFAQSSLLSNRSIEAESGTNTGIAKVFDDNNASGGRYLGFEATVNPPTTGCASPKHTPGGDDGMGGCWPGESNTGVPAGTILSEYTGSCRIDIPNVVIENKIFNCGLSIQAINVTIKNSIIYGQVGVGTNVSVTIINSEIQLQTGQDTGIASRNFTVLNSQLRGGRRGAYCDDNCIIRDSWIHSQDIPQDSNWHASGMRASQDTQYIHNSIHCDATDTPSGGCSANLTMYGDFEPVQRVLIERNLFKAGLLQGYCSYGGSTRFKTYSNDASDIVFRDNVFQRGVSGKCGVYGPISGFDSSRPGNIWSNNKWDDGTAL